MTVTVLHRFLFKFEIIIHMTPRMEILKLFKDLFIVTFEFKHINAGLYADF